MCRLDALKSGSSGPGYSKFIMALHGYKGSVRRRSRPTLPRCDILMAGEAPLVRSQTRTMVVETVCPSCVDIFPAIPKLMLLLCHTFLFGPRKVSSHGDTIGIYIFS